MLWGKAEGYEWFNLGMAPLSGLEPTALAPVRVKIASYLYRFGQPFYNFQGLRAYKEKFHPVWEPRYLAYPGVLDLPRVSAGCLDADRGWLRRDSERDTVRQVRRVRQVRQVQERRRRHACSEPDEPVEPVEPTEDVVQ